MHWFKPTTCWARSSWQRSITQCCIFIFAQKKRSEHKHTWKCGRGWGSVMRKRGICLFMFFHYALPREKKSTLKEKNCKMWYMMSQAAIRRLIESFDPKGGGASATSACIVFQHYSGYLDFILKVCNEIKSLLFFILDYTHIGNSWNRAKTRQDK